MNLYTVHYVILSWYTRVVLVSAGTQPLMVTSSVIHYAAHSEYLEFLNLLAFLPVFVAGEAFTFCQTVSSWQVLTRLYALPQGAVLTPGMDHTMSIQPTSMMGPLTQQLSHLSMGSSGTVSRLSLIFHSETVDTLVAQSGS